VAKVGNVRLEWSRELASFVVEVAPTPLPASMNDVGIDLGRLVWRPLSTGEVIVNPRHLRRKARALARAQCSLARKSNGSNNRKKAVGRVAVLHRKVRETRRWSPSSQLCSYCGLASGRKPLQVGEWTCEGCGATHDRNTNAALNVLIEGRKVAAVPGETQNACGADVRPEPVLAVGTETGTRRSASMNSGAEGIPVVHGREEVKRLRQQQQGQGQGLGHDPASRDDGLHTGRAIDGCHTR